MAELKRFEKTGLDSLAQYLAGFEGVQSDPEYWQSRFKLWWDGNPAFTPESTRGWVLEVKGHIVGFLGTIPSRMLVNGEVRPAHSITTWMVDEPFRNDSLAMLLELLDHAGPDPVFDTTPTDHVAEVLKSLEFEPLPWGPEKEYFYSSDPRPLTGMIVGTILGGFQKLRSRFKVPAGLRVEVVSELAQTDYDALWERTRGQFKTTNVRDASAVRWSALSDSTVKKRLYECRDAGKLRGFLILKPRFRRGVETFECADLWTDPEHPEALEALVSRAAQESPLVSFPFFTPDIGEQLGNFGMLQVPTRQRKNLWLPPKGYNPEDSYFCLLQGDYGTAP